jgi:hypothetical protein
MTTSASLSASRLPISCSERSCQAASEVTARIADSTETRSCGPSNKPGSFQVR